MMSSTYEMADPPRSLSRVYRKPKCLSCPILMICLYLCNMASSLILLNQRKYHASVKGMHSLITQWDIHRSVITDLLQSIPHMYKDNMRPESVFTSAVRGALTALVSKGSG